MILVVLAVTIAFVILGYVLATTLFDDEVGIGICVVGSLAFLVAFGFTIWLGVEVSNLTVIDEQIEMYQEENSKIEAQISEVVKQYQEYETGIFTEVSPDSSITLVSLYPELKSDALVQSQIEMYSSNNAKIKQLRERSIKASVYRWWLYFGK